MLTLVFVLISMMRRSSLLGAVCVCWGGAVVGGGSSCGVMNVVVTVDIPSGLLVVKVVVS